MIKIAAFGCWNVGCKKSSGQEKVTELIQTKNDKCKYSFMIILGDNYYPEKTEMLTILQLLS